MESRGAPPLRNKGPGMPRDSNDAGSFHTSSKHAVDLSADTSCPTLDRSHTDEFTPDVVIKVTRVSWCSIRRDWAV